MYDNADLLHFRPLPILLQTAYKIMWYSPMQWHSRRIIQLAHVDISPLAVIPRQFSVEKKWSGNETTSCWGSEGICTPMQGILGYSEVH